MNDHDPLLTELRALASAAGRAEGAVFERMIFWIGQNFLERGMTVIDAGAHSGLHAIPFARRVGWRGRIEAFEPIPFLVRKLRRRRLMKLLPQLRVHPVALGDEQREVEFVCFASRPEYSGLKRRETPFDDEEGGRMLLKVPLVRLDDRLSSLRPVSLIKLDLEGGEFHALAGARKLLVRDRPLVIFECGLEQSARTYGYDADAFFSLFESMDYRLLTLAGTPFEREHWSAPGTGWNFVAAPAEAPDVRRLLERAARTTQQELQVDELVQRQRGGHTG